MKNVSKGYTYEPENGNTSVNIWTDIGRFWGYSRFNYEKDKGEPSEWIGCSIAEDRAMIKYTNEKIALKKAEIKGLERFIKSYYKDPKTQAKAKNLLKAMNKELEDLKIKIVYCRPIYALCAVYSLQSSIDELNTRYNYLVTELNELKKKISG